MKIETELIIAATDFFRPIVAQCVEESFNRVALSTYPATSAAEPAELLTSEETAKLLKVTKVTVWDWEKKGILKKYHIGNQVRYLRSEVIAAVTKKQQAA